MPNRLGRAGAGRPAGVTDPVIQAAGGVLSRHGARGKRVCVGLSGGLDSMVLLDALDRLRAEFQLALSAIHVNHGISQHAASWEAFCEAACRSRGVPLFARRVVVDDRGAGIEAAARAMRYAAYASLDCDFVALAHHLDDQAETLLLQLLRGAGLRGLSAMPEYRLAAAGQPAILRPLLRVSRAQIAAAAAARGLDWVEDDSNSDARHDRNFLRHEVMPRLAARFPGYRETLARAALNFADAQSLAEDLAQLDAGDAGGSYVLAERLRALSDARALNLLRFMFARRELPMPNRARLEEALRQCREAAPDAEMRIVFGSHALRCYRGRIELVEESGMSMAGWEAQWNGREVLALPQGLGELHPRPAFGGGIAVRHFREGPATVRGRSGGEAMRPADNRPTRTLKHLLQESAVPPWERARMPLLFFGERLAWVPGVGVAAEFRAGQSEPGIEPEWRRG